MIAKAGKPLVKVTPLDTPVAGQVRRLGFMAGRIQVPDDFDRAFACRGARVAGRSAQRADFQLRNPASQRAALRHQRLSHARGELVEGDDLVERGVGHDAGHQGGVHGVAGALGNDVAQ